MFQVFSFFIYWLKQVDEHSIHSPFVYDFYTQVIRGLNLAYPDVEKLRWKLLQDKRIIKVHDYGAGSRVSFTSERSVQSITKHASTPERFSALLSYLINYFQFTDILELGTSLGINTLYLSHDSKVNVLTLEGDPNIAAIAQSNFSELNRKNIKTIVGNIDDTLSQALENTAQFDLVYMDANHRYEPTLRYFELISAKIHQHSIVVVDDIHWSKEMNNAWQALKSKPEVTLSIDLFEGGLLFFDPKFEKGDYVLKF